MTDLTPTEMLEAAATFADLHRWAAPAWRHVATGTASRKAILEDAAEMTARLEELQAFLLKSETTDVPEGT